MSVDTNNTYKVNTIRHLEYVFGIDDSLLNGL